ncbi:hypothetical protein [Mucilaginibacter sp. HD30]
MERKITLTIDNPNRNFKAQEDEKNQHAYIIFSDTPRKGANTEAGFLIVDQLFQNGKTRKKWYKDRLSYNIHSTDEDGNKITSKPLNYLIIAEYIREKGYFERIDFNLLAIECRWLDYSMDLKYDAHFVDENNETFAISDGTGEQIYGKSYPIIPKLDREGRSFTNLFPLLIRRISKNRTKLVETSRLALTTDWFLDLRTLISDTVSLIEITLNQLYLKAEYDPLPNWIFDKDRLGHRHGRRFKDKLGWVYQISGRHLNAESYIPNCDKLRELRNHMMHFDPPSFIITAEEAADWLNYIIDVGYLLIAIRKTLGVEVSFDLINFILQKEAIFNPHPHFYKRLPLSKSGAGYVSSIWPSKES